MEALFPSEVKEDFSQVLSDSRFYIMEERNKKKKMMRMRTKRNRKRTRFIHLTFSRISRIRSPKKAIAPFRQ